MPETEAESINVLRALVERYHPHGPASEGLRTIYTRACHVVHHNMTPRPPRRSARCSVGLLSREGGADGHTASDQAPQREVVQPW